MKRRNRSIALLIATIAATVYTIGLISYFYSVNTAANETAEALSGAIATALVTPHMIMFLVGAVFGWVGVVFKKAWGALVAAILYAVGTVVFLVYAVFGVPILVLGFIGYAMQMKINRIQLNEEPRRN